MDLKTWISVSRQRILENRWVMHALLGLLTDQSVRFLEKHLLAWRPSILREAAR